MFGTASGTTIKDEPGKELSEYENTNFFSNFAFVRCSPFIV